MRDDVGRVGVGTDWVVPDSSVYVDYVICCALVLAGFGGTYGGFFVTEIRKSQGLKECLDRRFRDGSVRVTGTVRRETGDVALRKVMAWKSRRAASRANLRRLATYVFRYVGDHDYSMVPPRMRCPDDGSRLGDVRGVYADARAKPCDGGLVEEWRRRKLRKGRRAVRAGSGWPGPGDETMLPRPRPLRPSIPWCSSRPALAPWCSAR